MSNEQEVTNPAYQMKKIFTKPSFGMNGVQVVNNGILPPQSQPQIYRGHRKKFGRTYINILHDPRVVRGNTYAAFVIPSSLQMEFLRMKEEEEKRRKLMKIPKRLPRVAYLGKNKKEIIEEVEEEEKKAESPILKPIENKELIEDKGYFYEDRPPTPKYIPLPAGKEEETQIIDGELFNYDMEVEPILQVLIGRSLIQAQYELIEDYEREEYIKHKTQYEMNREFELLNLQRTEAKHIRKEEERQRRYVQKEQRQKHDCIIQRKLISNVFSKRICNNLKHSSLSQLQERGFLKRHLEYLLNFYVKKVYYPIAVRIEDCNVQINTKVTEQIKQEEDDEIMALHHNSVKREQERIAAIIQKKTEEEQRALEEKNRLKKEQLERRENRRIKRITDSITTNIINSKSTRKDVTFLLLSDIDELSTRADSIHSLGGALGEIVFVLNEVLSTILPESAKEEIELAPFLKAFIEEFLMNGLSETQMLELKYLESPKFDFENIQEERRPEYFAFLQDKRRYVSKSLKTLVELKKINEDIVNQFNSVIAEIFFKGNAEPDKIEVDPENQEQEYLDKIKREQDEAERKAMQLNAKNEKLKKKIKLSFLNPSVFKKKKGNIGGFIVIEPNNIEIGNVSVVEEVFQAKEELPKEENLNSKRENEEGQKEEEAKAPIEEAEKAKPPEAQEPNPEVKAEDQPQVAQQPPVPEKTNIQQTTQMDYLTEIQVYKNYSIPIDTYVFHHGMTQWYQALIIKSLRQIFKKMNIDLPLIDTFKVIKERYRNVANELINHILTTERYLEKTIIPINISCVIKEEEMLASDPNQNPVSQQE